METLTIALSVDVSLADDPEYREFLVETARRMIVAQLDRLPLST